MVISADISARDELGLTAADRSAVQDTAQSFGAILVLARPDERMQAIMARPDTTPARTTLAVPSADRDVGTRQLRHFVVDRGTVPEAFSDARGSGADTEWQRLLASHGATTSQELNERHAKGLTPYSVDLKPKSETIGVLKDRGKLVHAGLAIRDVIAVPIQVHAPDPNWDPDWDSGDVTVSASRSSIAQTLGARLGQRIELAGEGSLASDDQATAFTPALYAESEPGSGSILEIALLSVSDLHEMRELVRRLRTLRQSFAHLSPRESSLKDLRSLAVASAAGITTP